MDFDAKTFCAAPWFQIKTDQSGHYRVCNSINPGASSFSHSEMSWPDQNPTQFVNSDYVTYLREQLTQGVRLPECALCWRNESCGGVSQRQIINNTVTRNRGHDLHNTWLRSYLDRKKDSSFDHLLSADIKLSNVCNFHCAMCGPDDSSRIEASWRRDRDLPVIQIMLAGRDDLLDQVRKRHRDHDRNLRVLAEVLSHPIKNLKLLGGEPLLDREALDLLISLSDAKKSQIAVSFVTNGSVDLTAITDQLQGFRDIHFAVSLDSIGTVQDFIRRGSDWQQIAHNLDAWRSQHPSKLMTVVCTLQALNILHLRDLIVWCQTRHIELHFGHVTNPACLSLSAVPPILRQQAVDQIKDLTDFDLSSLLDKFPHDTDLIPRMAQYMQWYDPSWLETLPEWSDHVCA